ncbi:MAG: PorT family protein [Bacteroidia bacterium]|nr:PorT family protein [Bacteroidia bacterium]
MKKFTILLILALAAAPLLKAQEGVKIGLRFAPIVAFTSITNEAGNDLPGTTVSSRLGYSYGLMATYGFTDNYGIYTGVHIVNKGFSRTDVGDSLTSTQKVTATTVEIPIALRGRSNEIGNGIYINGLFGISLDVKAAYKNEFTGSNPVTGELGNGTTKDLALINPLTASFLFGAGADWYVDRVGTFNFGLIFHQGLVNLNSQKNFNNLEVIKVSYLSLDLAYLF